MAAITEDECRRLKLLRILETAGQRVLTYTLLCGTPGKPFTVTLVEYLDNLPLHSTANYKQERNPSRSFNSTDRNQIYSDPSCTTFDVTLLHKSIKLACENVAGINEMVNNVNVWTVPSPLPYRELEHYCTQIKEERNALVHEAQPHGEAAFNTKVETLRSLFNNCLKATKVRYARDDIEYQAEKAAVQTQVTAIQQETLGVDDLLQRSAATILPHFKQETDQELRAGLDNSRYLTPLHFLSGIPQDRVKVSDIFCDITLAEGQETHLQGDTDRIPYLEVLRLCEAATASTRGGGGLLGQVRPKVLVVEGEAGSGKTTWACFLVQQWLTSEERRMRGLDRYELVLRVVCRERSSPTLEGLLRQLLPESHIRYRYLLLPLLKKCRVLIIIDGIDEMNDVSRPLVENILSEASITSFTIVCTSRPHCVKDLKVKARGMHFQVFHIKMLGISDDIHRMELVVKHYQWLCGSASPATDTAALRQAVRGIIWRDVFRLPLNLLFLVTVFYFEPHRVSSSLCQCDLYKHIHTWCTEKLLSSLSMSHQDSVNEVLNVLYMVALKGLLQDRMCLNDQDLEMVKNACRPNLDYRVVLSAYYSMRREVTAGVERETYMAPHKSLQEFMAAKGIAGQVREYSEGAIDCALRKFTAGQDPPLRQLRQTLLHLLTLLMDQGDTMIEVVNLLRESGLTGTREWLDLLTDAMAPDSVVQHAAKQLVEWGLHDYEEIKISDERVPVANVMLQHLPRQKVLVRLRREVADVNNLAQSLSQHEVSELFLQHHWRHPHQQSTSTTLLKHIRRNDLQSFRGHLGSKDLSALLPEDLEYLHLVVRDSDHAQTLLPALAKTCNSSQRLRSIKLHIPVGTVSSAAVTRLPARPDLDLYLSGVTDVLVEAAVNIVAELCPPRQGFFNLYFPEATLDLRKWEDLFTRLERARVRVRDNVYVPATNVPEDEERELRNLATTKLGCWRVERWSNDDMWRR